MGREGRAQVAHRLARDGAARGGAVAPVAQQVRGAGVEPGQQVEGRDRPARAGPLVSLERHHDDRAVVALGQARSDYPDDAGMPAVGGQDVGRPVARGRDLRLGLEEDARLGVAALGVGGVELGGDGLGARVVLGQHELQPRVGAVKAARGVDPRRETEADRARVEGPRVHRGNPHERAQPDLARRGQRPQPLAHQPAVLTAQRDAVGHGGQRHEVEVLPRRPRRTPGVGQRGDELVRDAGGAEVRTRVAPDHGMDDRGVGQRARARLVVVGHHNVDPGGAGTRHLLDRGDRAIDRHQQPRAACGQAVDRGGVQSVAVVGAARQVPVRVGSQGAQAAEEDRGRADAVDVVVAVDGDARAAGDMAQDDLDGGRHPVECGRRMLVGRLQPGPGGGRRAEAAAHQDLRGRVAHAELALQGEDVGDGAGRDLEAALQGGRSLGARPDGNGGARADTLVMAPDPNPSNATGAIQSSRRGRRLGAA
jgi:hypothetical protein